MNVLFSSTLGWNCGDEFIHWGVRRLVEHVLERRINPVLYSRNPDTLRMGPEHQTSDAWRPKHGLRSIDLFVQSGTPEWQGLHLAPLYEELAHRRRIPIWFVGIGAAHAYKLSRLDERILRRARVVICRDRTAEEVCRPFNRRTVRLPCPSLFAVPSAREEPEAYEHDIGLVWQRDSVPNQSCSDVVSRAVWRAAERIKGGGARVRIIAHYVDEFHKAVKRRTFPVAYSFEPHDYPAIFAEHPVVASTRLHGALLAVSLGIPACMLQGDDLRCVGASEEVAPLDVVRPDDLPDWFGSMGPEARRRRRDELVRLREEAWHRYLEAMRA